MPKRQYSLSLRLVATSSLISALSLILVGIILSAIFYSTFERSFDRQLEVNIDALAASVDVVDNKIVVPLPPTDPRFSRPLSGYYWQVNFIKSGQLEADGVKSRSLFDETLVAPEGLINNAQNKMGEIISININRADESLRLASKIIKLPDYPEPLILMATGDIKEIKTSSINFNRILIFSLLSFAFALIVAIYFQVKIGLLPLTKMRRELYEIRQGNQNNLDEEISSELAPIAKELNALLIHNQEVVERARTHVGNLAHALKTPLSVMLNESRSNKGAFGELVENQTMTMTRQVEHYLKRAQAAARAQTLRARTHIQSVIDDLIRTLGRLYARDGVKIEINNKTEHFFRGDREDLEDMIGNLTENACKYGGGLVELSIQNEDDFINIIIDDDGDGLNENQMKEALLRGVRLDETSHGSGLGLSIVDELSRAYGGSLNLEKSHLGGLRVNLRLPITNT